MHGEGYYTWKDGTNYEGQFVNNNIHGFGKFTSAKGKIYEGMWVNNEKHGQGIIHWPDDRHYIGAF